ncbi:hypothetical protein GCM10028787_32850 [Brachybacterium horti]
MRMKSKLFGVLAAAFLLMPTSAALAEGADGGGIVEGETGDSGDSFQGIRDPLIEARTEQTPQEVADRIASGRDDYVLFGDDGETLAALDLSEMKAATGNDSSFQMLAISPIHVGCDMSSLTAQNMCVGYNGKYRTGFSGTGRYTTTIKKVEVFQSGSRPSGVQLSSGKWTRVKAHQTGAFSSPTTIVAVERT